MAKGVRGRLRGTIGGLARVLGHHEADRAPVTAAPADAATTAMHKGTVAAAGLAANATPLTVTVRAVTVDDDSPDRDA